MLQTQPNRIPTFLYMGSSMFLEYSVPDFRARAIFGAFSVSPAFDGTSILLHDLAPGFLSFYHAVVSGLSTIHLAPTRRVRRILDFHAKCC